MLPPKKPLDAVKTRDDSLFGLLSSYKLHTSYFKILASAAEGKAVVQLTDNPRCWAAVPAERYAAYVPVRRHEVGTAKLSVKYLTASNIIKTFGPTLGLKLPKKRTVIENALDTGGCFLMEFPLEVLPLVIQTVRKIITLSPQRKYEIIEKCLSEN